MQIFPHSKRPKTNRMFVDFIILQKDEIHPSNTEQRNPIRARGDVFLSNHLPFTELEEDVFDFTNLALNK